MINWAKLVRVSEMRGDSDKDTALLNEMYETARHYVESFRWCKGVDEAYFGCGVGGVVAAFLVRIERAMPEVDENLWVVVGDLPPAYLVTDNAPDPASALRVYIDEMMRWVNAIMAGGSTDDLIPVNAPATAANAQDLKSRLDFIREKILNAYL